MSRVIIGIRVRNMHLGRGKKQQQQIDSSLCVGLFFEINAPFVVHLLLQITRLFNLTIAFFHVFFFALSLLSVPFIIFSFSFFSTIFFILQIYYQQLVCYVCISICILFVFLSLSLSVCTLVYFVKNNMNIKFVQFHCITIVAVMFLLALLLRLHSYQKSAQKTFGPRNCFHFIPIYLSICLCLL